MTCKSCRRNPADDRFAGRLDVRRGRVLWTEGGKVLSISDLYKSSDWLRFRPIVKAGIPRLELDPPLLLKRRTKGKKPLKITTVGLLTATTKMRCWSFSLPAGPPGKGGSCVSSEIDAAPGRVPICAGCYATSGMYGMYDSIGVQQQIRKEWARRMVASGQFSSAMIAVLRTAWKYKTVRRGIVSDEDSKQIDPRFFRLHDSGDLGWLPGYPSAWARVAEMFDRVLFWAPTRDLWTGGTRLHDELDYLAHRIILRPSAYHFWDPPPMLGSPFAAGTTSAVGMEPARDCPAVLNGLRHRYGKTCATAHCRKCWLQPNVPVAYAPHGTGVEEAPGMGQKPRKNPLPSLEEAISAYEHGTRQNPGGDGLGGFLNDHGINPSDYPEEHWEQVFDRRSVAPEDRLDTLEQLAEWDL